MDQNPKQLIVEKLLSASNVLVTVSNNPTVDQLSAALGMALMLEALDVRATALFSGQIPNAIEFLQPEKTFDNTVDGLRDFIISIDKDKADKLRYKVEDNIVKIFITPYKSTISEKDLIFSQGDFNVDVVLALGVSQRSELDQAITAHGRILHDAAIASITAGGEPAGDLGSINWHDPTASSLSEMLVSMSEALKSGIIDKSMATAFLTGIVAATERFSNTKTTPKVMTMAAQLMAAGADQQLIAKNLRMDRGRAKDLANENTPVKADDGLKTLADIEHDIKADEIVPEPVAPPAVTLSEPEPVAPPAVTLPEPDLEDEHKLIDAELEEPAPPITTQTGFDDSLAEQADQTDERPDFQGDVEIVSKQPPEVDDVNEARNAVEQAISATDFSVANKPIEALGAKPLELGGVATEELGQQIQIDDQGRLAMVETPQMPKIAPTIAPPLPPRPSQIVVENPIQPLAESAQAEPPITNGQPENPLFKQQ